MHSENRPHPSLGVNSDITDLLHPYEIILVILINSKVFLMIQFVCCLSCFLTRELGTSGKLFNLGLEELMEVGSCQCSEKLTLLFAPLMQTLLATLDV